MSGKSAKWQGGKIVREIRETSRQMAQCQGIFCNRLLLFYAYSVREMSENLTFQIVWPCERVSNGGAVSARESQGEGGIAPPVLSLALTAPPFDTISFA